MGYVCKLAVFSLLLGLTAVAAPLSTLEPGGFRQIAQDLTINVVFVGYESGSGPRDINEAAFRAVLPGAYRPIHRTPDFYGIRQFVGLTFNFQYNMVYASQAWEDSFFAYMASIAVAKPLTLEQQNYNGEAGRSLTIPANGNHWIDAPSVEKWLAANPPAGVDTTRYTAFFINWYGRPDFKFHAYVKTDEPDPDTGYNFGQIRSSRKIIAWGGTAADDPESGLGSLHRIWFYDLSAGPETWTTNWDLTRADVDGNDVLDYRMPPVWEYGNSTGQTYRLFNDLSGDLGKIMRYVGIDLLFTASPLYKPLISPPKLPSDLQLDINVYQGESGVDATSFINRSKIIEKLSPLQPLNVFTTEVTSLPFAGRALDTYLCFLTAFLGPPPFGSSCYGQRLFGIAFGDLFLYHDDHLMTFLEGDADYEVPVFAFNTPDQIQPGGLLGFADDNWRDGTQSYVFAFLSPFVRQFGYGLSTTAIHEVGHHLGMSHPHDGFDFEANIDFGPGDDFYFAWAGDESNSVMNYLDLNFDFGQFDRDNMNRFLTVGYINEANAVLKLIAASPRAGQAATLVSAADSRAAAALSAYGAMNYSGAAAQAKDAYLKVLAAAASIDVKVEPQSWRADYRARGTSTKFVDPLQYPRTAP